MRRRQKLSCRRLARRRLHRVRRRYPAPALRHRRPRLPARPATPAAQGSILVTNPPFSKLDEFVARSFALFEAGHLAAAVLLFRNDFGGTQGRVDHLNRAVAEFECCGRPRWTREPRAIRAFGRCGARGCPIASGRPSITA
jgi:hypothetical protein